VLDRLTKLFVVGWVLAALAFEFWLLRFYGFNSAAGMLFAAPFAAALFWPAAIAIVLAFTYLFPVLIWLSVGSYDSTMSVLWLAPLVGAMLPSIAVRPWHLPARWRAPVVSWAMVIAVTASIVVCRELDFRVALFEERGLPNTSIGGAPGSMSLFAVHTALTLVVGILWIEFLFSVRASMARALVVFPLAASAAVMAAVAIFQMLFGVTILNPTVFGATGRATGTVLDGNVCGAVAALWIGAAFWARRSRARAWDAAIAAQVLVFGVAVWASGSRTAFWGAAIILAITLAGPLLSGGWRRARLAVYGLAAGVAVIASLWLLSPRPANKYGLSDTVTGPFTRMPTTWTGMRALASDLWGRAEYGTVAVAMIRQFPLSGVGVGMYPMMAADFGGSHKPDNAQNWFRHQLAEFGIIGSLPWIAWTASFALLLFRFRRADSQAAWASRGLLVGFALISLVGMPGQDIGVAVTFWTAVYWFTSETSTGDVRAVSATWQWAAALAIVAAAGAVTFVEAKDGLRVPVRAQRVGWPYEYGFYPAQPDAQGNERWTGRHAVAVVEAPKPWIVLTAAVNPMALVPGANRSLATPVHPVDLRVWCDGVLAIDQRVTTSAAATAAVHVPEGEARVRLEVDVSDTFRPRMVGVADDREYGALVGWSFADKP
jgi:hypothetical protein